MSRAITLDFQGGETRMLIAKQSYDARFAADDGVMPMTVAPGAGEGGLPASPAGDTPRLVLLAVRGTQVPWAIVGGGDEPSLEPDKVYRTQLGTWQKVQASPGSQDVVLDTQPGGTVRLSLVDGSFNVVPETAFRVHRCPRGEHLTAESPAPEPCTLGPVDSDAMTGILPSLALNEAGGARGYLGIELTRAPVDPGTYYVLVESTGATPYRIRQGADLVRRNGQESEYLGAYAVCTVAGMEFLDQNFQRVDSFEVNDPTPAYVRLLRSAPEAPSVACQIRVQDRSGSIVSPEQTVDLSRVAAGSSVYIGAVTFEPDVAASPASSRSAESLTSSGVFMVPLGANSAVASAGATAGICGVNRPAKLRFRFARRGCFDVDDTCLTAGDAAGLGASQETEVGEACENYAEVVHLQIQAVDPSDPTRVCVACTGVKVGIAEEANSSYSGDYRFFFDGKHGASQLDRKGWIDGKTPYTLSGGRALVILRSVADARLIDGQVYPSLSRQPTIAPPPASSFSGKAMYVGEYGPWMRAVELGRASGAVTNGDVQKDYGIWVDERSYSRQRGQPGNWSGSSNDVRDWLEKKVRDFYGDWSGTNGEIMEGMGRLGWLSDMTKDRKGDACDATAYTTRGERAANGEIADASVTWCLSELGVRRDALPAEVQGRSFDQLGLRVPMPGRPFDYLAIHEARHIWQDTLTASCGSDDTDSDEVHTDPPPSAAIIADDRYELGGYGLNPEFDFLHYRIGDWNQWADVGGTSGVAGREADAIRVSAPLAGVTIACLPASNYLLELTSAPLGNGYSLNARVAYRKYGTSGPDLPYEGVTVVFERVGQGNMLLSEWVPSGFQPDPSTWFADFGVDPATVFRPDGPVAVSRARYTGPARGTTEARVFVKQPTGPTATRFRAILVVPRTECGSTMVSKELVISP